MEKILRGRKIARNAEPGNPVRTLIYLPIVHTRADMGSMGDSVTRAGLQKWGRVGLKRKALAIDQVWDDIDNRIAGLNLDYSQVRLYQDGLPVCGREAEIVRDLAGQGSRNHQLLLRLMELGATLMGTEASALLMQEYELARETLGAGGAGVGRRPRRQARAEALLRERDQYIAARINDTLQAGETGVLFLGMLHSLKDRLAEDIRVVYPLGGP